MIVTAAPRAAPAPATEMNVTELSETHADERQLVKPIRTDSEVSEEPKLTPLSVIVAPASVGILGGVIVVSTATSYVKPCVVAVPTTSPTVTRRAKSFPVPLPMTHCNRVDEIQTEEAQEEPPIRIDGVVSTE